MREYYPDRPKIYINEKFMDIVTTDPKMAYYYSLNFIQEPFPRGETAIARSAKYSFRYAINILKGRFKQGEKNIKGSNYEDSYKEYFKIEEWEKDVKRGEEEDG